MNKTILTICAIAAATLLAGCQKEINTEPIQEETFHSVIFTAEKIIDTKTAIASEENGTVSYKWNDDDWERMYITESYTSGEEVVTNAGTVTGMTLSNGGKSATFNVTFPGTAPETGVTYNAVYGGSFSGNHNPLIPSEQSPLANTFDPAADVLVSDGFTKTTAGENTVYKFSMKRKVSVNKMTLKGLTAGETISSVTFESDKNHSAYYNVSAYYNDASDEYTSPVVKKLTFTYTENNTIPEGGEFPVYFTTAPVTDATFTVSVVTNQHRYIKTSAKTISFAVGQVRRFGVDLTGFESTGRVFDLVTNVNQLQIGADVVIAANGSKNIAMSTTQNTNNRGVTEATKNSDYTTITTTELVQIFKLVEGSSSGTYAFSFDNDGITNYLFADGGGNYLRSKSTRDESASWAITISDNEASISTHIIDNNATVTKYLRYNSPNIFSCYTSGQQTVYLYQASPLPSPGMSWSSSTATASITANGVEFTAPTLNVGNASSVHYSSSAPEVATIATDGTVTIAGEGTTIIDAIFDGNSSYAPQTVSYTLTVTDIRVAVATPTFNPAAGNVSAGTTVTISTTTSGATIYYTTNGDTPTTSSDVYSSPITVTGSVTIKAIAVKEGFKNSEVATATYTVSTTIAEILADNTITSSHTVHYDVSGVTIMAAQGKNYVIGDATGVMLMYCTVSPALTVGSQYDVQGDVKLYNGVHEFASPTVQTSSGTAPEYGTPEEMTVASLTAYSSSPATKYAIVSMTAPTSGYVGSDGTNSIQIYDGTGSLSSYYGKSIIVTGYLIGYNNGNVVILATNIEEDTSTPSLSVDPTSLSWAADESGSSVAKSVTVTRNGDASYSVSYTDTESKWTVSDDEAGTITVYPNAANTSQDDDNTLTLTITHGVDASLTKTVTCTQAKAPSNAPTFTYYFTSKDWQATRDGNAENWTSGKDGNSFQGDSGQGVQVTTGSTGANGTSPYSFTDVEEIVVTYSTNATKGAGSIQVTVGNGTAQSYTVTKPSSGGTTAKTATFSYSTKESGNIKLLVNCTDNSVYIASISIKAASIDLPILEENLTTNGLPTEFSVGSSFGFGTGTVTAHYTDGSTKNLTIDDVTIEGFNSTSEVEGQNVTIKYTEGTVTASVSISINIVSNAVTLVPNQTFTFSSLYNSNTTLDGITISGTHCSLVFNKRSGGTATQYYTNGSAVRWYGGGTLAITAPTGYKITSIKITYTQTANSVTASCGTYSLSNSVGTWIGDISNGSSVTFTQSGTSGHCRISAIEIN